MDHTVGLKLQGTENYFNYFFSPHGCRAKINQAKRNKERNDYKETKQHTTKKLIFNDEKKKEIFKKLP